MVLKDGAHHAVDSSEMAFRSAAIGAVKQGGLLMYDDIHSAHLHTAFPNGMPCLLEPVMAVEINVPEEFQVNN